MGVLDDAAGTGMPLAARERGDRRVEPVAPMFRPWAGRGSPAAARRMARGVWLSDGELIETAPGAAPWIYGAVPKGWVTYLHGHTWLDDFAVLQEETSWSAGARWVHEWIGTFGWGQGPGWTASLVAERQVRWLCHRGLLLSEASDREAALLQRAIHRQGRFLAWHWWRTPPGLARLEVLSAHLLTRLWSDGPSNVKGLVRAFGREAARLSAVEEELLGRNPMRLMRLVDLFSAMAVSLEEKGLDPDPRHREALTQFGLLLAGLCHADGRLARFHGAPAGRAGDARRVLERLPDTGPLMGHALGYARIERGPSDLIMDAAPGARFASALAIELTCGSQALIVSSGSGLGFGAAEEGHARETRAHSTLTLAGQSHDLTPAAICPQLTSAEVTEEAAADWIHGHTGVWRATHGVDYQRRIRLSRDGLSVQGEEVLKPITDADRARMQRYLAPDPRPGFEIRFLVHPSIVLRRSKNPREQLLRLPDGRLWRLTCRGAVLSIEPALFYDTARLHRRATKTIVASGHFLEYLGRMTWSLEALPSSSF